MTNPSQPPAVPDQGQQQATPSDTAKAAKLLGEAIAQVQRVIVGQEHMVEQLMVSLLAKGHCLLEGVPGVAKTLAVRSFATVVGGDFARIQFTPDLVPSDIVGTRIYSARQEKFDIALGPVFVNFVLADEINRAPAKVQSAMLELMAEQQVSIGGHTYPVPQPFIVIATQNPIESEGVYPLPEAQRDRFLLKVDVPYPRGNEEFEILRRMSVHPPHVRAGAQPGDGQAAAGAGVQRLRAQPRGRVRRAPGAGHADARGVRHARPHLRDPGGLQPACHAGPGGRRPRPGPHPRTRLRAAHRRPGRGPGRDVAPPVLGFDAVADNITPAQVIERIVAMVPPPTPVWNQQQRQAAQGQHRYTPEARN